MTTLDPKSFYSHFLKGHQGKLHFAAHSHHFWPDISREAQIKYWDDCASFSDEKWATIFSEVMPVTRQHIAEILNLKKSEQIVIAPNTHELTSRLLSLFVGRSTLSVLTTSSEFHSWKRQVLRLAELPEFHVHQISTESLLSDRSRFLETIKTELNNGHDLFYISQVFFDSGLALTVEELRDLQKNCPPKTIMVVDGYHGFAALPTDLSLLEGKIFYLGGGYKYAQAGEGVGFMVVPQGDWRPTYTGWFADYAKLSKSPGALVGYSPDAMAFAGATQDPSGCYRFNAVWDHFKSNKLSVEAIHKYVLQLQRVFLQHYPSESFKHLGLTPLFDPELTHHGHFLTFEAADEASAEQLHKKLMSSNILIDRRGPRLRFGFGLYQNIEDVQEMCLRLKNLAV